MLALLQMPGDLWVPFNVNTPDQARREIGRQWDEGADFIKLIQTKRDVFFAAVEAAHRKGLRIAGHLPPSIKMSEAAISGFDCVEHLGTSDNLWIECSKDADRLWREKDKKVVISRLGGSVPSVGRFFVALATDVIIKNAMKISARNLDILERALDTYDEGRARELAEIFVQKQTWQSPTLVGTRSKYQFDDPIYRTDPWLAVELAERRKFDLDMVEEYRKFSKRNIEVYHRYYQTTLHTVGLWHAAGVQFLSGTDTAGRMSGRSLHLEFEELARAGLSPLDILRSTTINPARYLGRTETMGRVIEHMNADIVLLDADPLASAMNLRSVSLVVRAGHAFTAGGAHGARDQACGQSGSASHSR